MTGRARIRWSGQWWRILLVIYLAYTLFFSAQQQLKLWEMGRQKVYLKRQVDLFQEKNRLLQEQINLLGTDEYIEKLAREQLGLIKPGEIPYRAGLPPEMATRR